MKKIKIGIIGCGSITEKRHAPEYCSNPHAEIAAFYDVNRERAELMSRLFGGRVAESYQEILNDPDIDAISDCTPNFMHSVISSEAMRKGKHVLCEKPMARSLDEAEGMLKVQKESGVIFMMDHNQRLNEAHTAGRKIVLEGKYGRLMTFKTNFGHGGPESWGVDKSKNTWFFKREKSSYGVVGDLGVHKLDLLRYLTGDEVEEIAGMGRVLDKKFENGEPIDVLDNAMASVKMKNGAMGVASFSWTYYGAEDNSTTLYFQEAIVKIYDDPKYQIKIFKKNGEIEKLQLGSMQTNEKQNSTGVIDNFIEAIRGKKAPAADINDGLASIKIIDALMRAIDQKKTIKI